MTAPVLHVNLAGPGAAAAAQAGAAGHGKANPGGEALAGFEAVFAALFGAAAETAPTVPVSPKRQAAADPTAGPGDATAADGETDADAAPQSSTTPTASPDPTLALLANVAPGAAASETPAAGKTPPTEAATPPAFGRDKAKGTHAAPALANANPHARLAEKAGPETPEPQTDAPALDAATAAPSHPEKPTAKAPPAFVAPTAGPRSGEPLVPADAKAAQQLEAPASEAVAVNALESEPQAIATDTALPETAAPIAQLAARAAPPGQPARGAPSPKSERAREAIEAAGPKSPAPARSADAPVSDTAVTAAPAADRETGDASARSQQTTDAPDSATAQPDAPQTTAGLAPAQHAAHTPVRGAPETVAHLAAQIVKKLENRSTRFDLELNPAGLGKVDVRLEIGASGQISAAMTFDNPQAAADVKARAGELQRALEQAGFNLTGGMSFDVAGDRGQSQQGWREAGEQAGHGLRGRAFQDALNTAGDAVDQAVSGALRLRRGLTSALDVRI